MSNVTSSSYPVITVTKSGDQFLVVQNGQLKKLTQAGLAAFIDGLAPDTLLELTDTPASYVGQQGKALVVAAGEQGMVFEAATAGNFLALTDTPNAYGGNATRLAVVKADETGLEFVDNSFVALTDTPSSLAGEGGQVVTVNVAGTALELVDPARAAATGWATYVDTVYVDAGSAFTVAATTDTLLPNNAGSVIETQKPQDVGEFYDGTVITGRDGDGLSFMIFFKAVPSAVDQSMDVWIDIGGAIGELYRETFSFPKGAGVERGVIYALPSTYTLSTWEANGATLYIRSTASLDIYDINYNFSRTHKAI